MSKGSFELHELGRTGDARESEHSGQEQKQEQTGLKNNEDEQAEEQENIKNNEDEQKQEQTGLKNNEDGRAQEQEYIKNNEDEQKQEKTGPKNNEDGQAQEQEQEQMGGKNNEDEQAEDKLHSADSTIADDEDDEEELSFQRMFNQAADAKIQTGQVAVAIISVVAVLFCVSKWIGAGVPLVSISQNDSFDYHSDYGRLQKCSVYEIGGEYSLKEEPQIIYPAFMILQCEKKILYQRNSILFRSYYVDISTPIMVRFINEQSAVLYRELKKQDCFYRTKK